MDHGSPACGGAATPRHGKGGKVGPVSKLRPRFQSRQVTSGPYAVNYDFCLNLDCVRDMIAL